MSTRLVIIGGVAYFIYDRFYGKTNLNFKAGAQALVENIKNSPLTKMGVKEYAEGKKDFDDIGNVEAITKEFVENPKNVEVWNRLQQDKFDQAAAIQSQHAEIEKMVVKEREAYDDFSGDFQQALDDHDMVGEISAVGSLVGEETKIIAEGQVAAAKKDVAVVVETAKVVTDKIDVGARVAVQETKKTAEAVGHEIKGAAVSVAGAGEGFLNTLGIKTRKKQKKKICKTRILGVCIAYRWK